MSWERGKWELWRYIRVPSCRMDHIWWQQQKKAIVKERQWHPSLLNIQSDFLWYWLRSAALKPMSITPLSICPFAILFIFWYTVGKNVGIEWHQMIILQFNGKCYLSAKLISSLGGNCYGKVDTAAQKSPHRNTHTHMDWSDCSLSSTLTSAVISGSPAAHFLTMETSITGLHGEKVRDCLSVPQL